jgi:adenosine deaminase
MIQTTLPYSFLVEALSLPPDDFIERMVKEDVYCGVKTMNAIIDEFTKVNVNMKVLRQYNTETLEAWDEYVSEKKWGCVKADNARSLFEYVRNFAHECLLFQQNEPLFRIEKTDIWQSVSFHCGEDLFVSALIATRHLEENHVPRDFQWNYILKSDFFLLNSLIKQRKIVENHYHLWGSAPNIDLSWLYLMNHPLGQKKRFESLLEKDTSYYGSVSSYQSIKRNDIYSLVKVAARIRLWLYRTCVLCENSNSAEYMLRNIYHSLERRIDLEAMQMGEEISFLRLQNDYKAFGTVADYAIEDTTVFPDKNNSFLVGERRLYYNCLSHIYQYNNPRYRSEDVQILFYLYLLIKHRFGSIFIQSNEKTGFQNFKEYQDRKGVIIGDTPYESMAAKMAIQETIEENCLEKLEVRISPKSTPEALSDAIRWIDEKAYPKTKERKCDFLQSDYKKDDFQNKARYFYVIHFLKGREMHWNEIIDDLPIYRERQKRKLYEQQAKALRNLRQRRLYGADRILGIDAASNEVNFRPEIFGQVFRYLSGPSVNYEVPFLPEDHPLPDLRKTYHVGEDFYDIIDGLRAIDEAVMFLELGNGDRIGHGVALGLDVEAWYHRHLKIALPIQNKLDNIAWILEKIRAWNLNVSAGFYEKLKVAFDNYYNIIYNCNVLPIHQHSPDLLSYVKAWELRGDNPKCYFNYKFDPSVLKQYDITEWDRYALRSIENYKDLKNNTIAYDLIHRYHFDTALKKRAREISVLTPGPELVALAKQLQIKMRNFILEKGIAVESCPSSNFLISNLEHFKDIPTFNLFPVQESNSDFVRLNVSINTDDQGVFFTSLQKEYAMLAGTLREIRNSDGLRVYSDDQILNWIEHLINNSKQQCFGSIV